LTSSTAAGVTILSRRAPSIRPALGGDGTDQLFAGSGGATLDGGVSNGEGDKYVGGKGADTFVIGNGTHAKQGTDAKFIIDNAGTNDKIVLRLSDTVGPGNSSAWTKGIVLNGGVQSLIWYDDGSLTTPHPQDPNHVGAVFSSVLVNPTGITADNSSGFPSASVDGRSLEYVRPEVGTFTVSYDWDKSASTLDIQIATSYGDFSVHVNNCKNGQLGLNFIDKKEPMDGLSLFHGDAAGLLQSSWNDYNGAVRSLVQGAQIIDLPSPGEPAEGNAAPVNPTTPGSGYLPEYGSSFNPEEGAAFGNSGTDPNDPKRAPFRDKDHNPLVKHDPLVFDLSGNGLHLTDVNLSATYIDFNGTGFATRTGWTDLSEGILINFDGTTNIGPGTILGVESGDGFGDLAAFDTNGDGRVDADDSQAATLRLWVDSNGDGKIAADELMTLNEAGIQTVNLQATPTDQSMNGNTILKSGSFVRSDGTIGDIYDVSLAYDPVLTQAIIPDGYAFSPVALTLPELAGYGHIANLRYAMSENQSLQSEALQLVLTSGAMTGGQFDAAFEHLIQSWAGVTNIDPTSHGPLIDARHMAVVEAFYGQTFEQLNGPGAELDEDAAANIEAAYHSIIDAMKVRFAAELPAAALANGASSEDVASNPLSALSAAIHYNPANDTISVNLNEFAAAAAGGAPVSAADRQGYFDYISHVAGALRVDLFTGDKWTFITNFTAALSSTNLAPGWQYQMLAELGADDIVEAAGQGATVGGTQNNDAILASSDDQTLSGGGGADVYIYSSADGNITIDEYSGQSQLLLTDIDPADASVVRDGDDIVLTIGSTGKTITMLNQPTGYGLQSVSFGDGTVWSQWHLANLVNPPNEYHGTLDDDDLEEPGYWNETYVRVMATTIFMTVE
jgi:hypothetical protein